MFSEYAHFYGTQTLSSIKKFLKKMFGTENDSQGSTCPVCLEDMTDLIPRTLKCLHSYCTYCLNKIVQLERIKCPTCRRVSNVPNNNVVSLPVNYHIKKKINQNEIISDRLDIKNTALVPFELKFPNRNLSIDLKEKKEIGFTTEGTNSEDLIEKTAFVQPEFPKLAFSLSKNCKIKLNIKMPKDIACLGMNLLIADGNHVIQIDQFGNLVEEYPITDGFGRITSVSCHNDDIYVIQQHGVTKFQNSFNKKALTKRKYFKPTVKEISKIHVLDKFTFLITDATEGKIYKFNVKKNTTELLVSGLHNPSYVSKIDSKANSHYAVTLSQSNVVQIYDKNWNLKKIIREGTCALSYPQGTVAYGGDILIADCDNHTVSRYSVDGVFLGHLLTNQQHDIEEPHCLAYSHPYLFVQQSCLLKTSFKCFKIH